MFALRVEFNRVGTRASSGRNPEGFCAKVKGLRIKRVFDFVLVLLTSVVWLPILVCLGVFVRFKLGGPVFFRQQRLGQNEQVFELVKFRTMIEVRDEKGELLPDAQRMTRFGRWLRSTSFDELPELWNVLKGQMSLVGPRPLLVKYLPLYSKEQRRRHLVPPGLTGWAQINGRNTIGWGQKFSLDVWYVDNRTLWIDLKILFQTLWTVVSRQGISSQGEATMSEFTGTSSE